MTKIIQIAAGAMIAVLAGCTSADCTLPDGSPSGFVRGSAPGHQVAPAGTSRDCPQASEP